MIKFSAVKGAACSVESGATSFLVFPDKPSDNERAIVSNPVEELQKKVVSWPGEYDFEGIFLRGVGQGDGKQVSYSCTMDGIRCGFVNAPIFDWSDADLEKFGNVDVLVIAADDEKKLRSLVENVDPRIVVLFGGGKELQACIKACGVSSAETMPQLKVQGSSLPVDARQVVVLEA